MAEIFQPGQLLTKAVGLTAGAALQLARSQPRLVAGLTASAAFKALESPIVRAGLSRAIEWTLDPRFPDIPTPAEAWDWYAQNTFRPLPGVAEIDNSPDAWPLATTPGGYVYIWRRERYGWLPWPYDRFEWQFLDGHQSTSPPTTTVTQVDGHGPGVDETEISYMSTADPPQPVTLANPAEPVRYILESATLQPGAEQAGGAAPSGEVWGRDRLWEDFLRRSEEYYDRPSVQEPLNFDAAAAPAGAAPAAPTLLDILTGIKPATAAEAGAVPAGKAVTRTTSTTGSAAITGASVSDVPKAIEGAEAVAGSYLLTAAGAVAGAPALPPAVTPTNEKRYGSLVVGQSGAVPRADSASIARELGRQEQKLGGLLGGLGIPEALLDLLELIQNFDEGTTYYLPRPCGTDANGDDLEPLEYPVAGGIGDTGAIKRRLDALASMLHDSKALRQPICAKKKEGAAVTVTFGEV